MNGSIGAQYVLLAGGILGVSSSPAQAQQSTPTRPKLAVVLVLDQFRAEYLTRYAPNFGNSGFKRLMREGSWMRQAHYSHGTTYTGPGHALIGSGSYGHTSGIVGNRWYNPATRRIESMFFDADAKLLGLDATPKDDDTSPRNFIGNNTADQLLLANRASKVVALSNKDRAAIMLAGKLGKAYWFHEGVGRLTTSTYYGATLPAWVQTFNARKIPDAYYGKAWAKSLPESAYSLSRVDNFAAETDLKGLGRVFPHPLSDKSGKPSPDFYEAFTATPFATDYQFEAARTAIESEGLGVDDNPDILGLSITATDIAGHTFGPDSQEVQDTVARLDAQLAGFLSYLDHRFKRGEVVLTLVADHGAAPVPEYMQSLGLDAGRIRSKTIGDATEAALTARFGAPADAATPNATWVLAVEDPGVFLNRALIAARNLDPSTVQKVAAEAVLSVTGIAATFTRDAFLSGQIPANRIAASYEKAFHPARSGDVTYATKPFYFNGSYGNRDTGSTHGSPYEYDTHVPLIFWGAGAKAGAHDEAVDVADLAPTLCGLLGIDAPAGNEGRSLLPLVNR